MLMTVLRVIAVCNTLILRVGRQVANYALALMVFVILLQVFFRYVANSALAWPDEAARFLMLWMIGLMAPSAYRWGGFVAIEILENYIPRRVSQILALILLLISGTVLWVGIGLGYSHAMGFGGNFDSSSLQLPLSLFGMENIKVKLRYMYASLLVGTTLMFLVNIELVLRSLAHIFHPDAEQPDDDNPHMRVMEAE